MGTAQSTLTPKAVDFILQHQYQSFGLIDYLGENPEKSVISLITSNGNLYQIRFDYKFEFNATTHNYHLRTGKELEGINPEIPTKEDLKQTLSKIKFNGQPVPLVDILYYSKEAAISALQFAIKDTKTYMTLLPPPAQGSVPTGK
jgi:hypothetical protein